ncbi:MAG: hypothetical protein C0485_16305 [Pirellula sp.]|nr:hypothetical protein [Pirellula sp.]
MKFIAYALIGAFVGSIVFAMIAGMIHGYRTSSRGGDIEQARRTMHVGLQPITAIGAIAGGIAGLNIATWRERR